MSAPKDEVVCHVCGFKNAATAERCVSCGAKLEELSAAYTAEEEAKRKGQFDGFDVKWAVLSVVVYLLLQAIALIALPALIDAYDPQGFSGLTVSLVVWLLGGVIVGALSPGRTLLEPAVAACVAVIPTIFWLAFTTPAAPEHLGGGFQQNGAVWVFGGVMSGMISLIGAFVGEKAQDYLRGRRANA